MKQIESYIPESQFYNGKDESKCRIFHDDCAVLSDDDDFRIIAARGFEKQIGQPFFEAVLTDSDARSRLSAFLRGTQDYLLLPFHEQSLLFLSAWHKSTTLVPVFLLHASEKNVRQMLNFASRDAFSELFRVANEPENGEESLREQLAEIFCYLDGLIKPGRNFWTSCRMLATFFGCCLENLSMPFEEKIASDALFHRVTAFLVCLLLSLRHRTGSVSAYGSVSAGEVHENVGKVQVEN